MLATDYSTLPPELMTYLRLTIEEGMVARMQLLTTVLLEVTQQCSELLSQSLRHVAGLRGKGSFLAQYSE